MGRIYADLVRESSLTTGTGALALSALTSFRRFSSVMAVSDTCYYSLRSGSDWEIGIGTYSATNTLTRTTIIASSNANAALNLAAGTKDVLMTVAGVKIAEFDLAKYSAAITNSAGATITAATHGQGTTPKVVITRGGVVVDVLISINGSGDVTWYSAEAFSGTIVIEA